MVQLGNIVMLYARAFFYCSNVRIIQLLGSISFVLSEQPHFFPDPVVDKEFTLLESRVMEKCLDVENTTFPGINILPTYWDVNNIMRLDRSQVRSSHDIKDNQSLVFHIAIMIVCLVVGFTLSALNLGLMALSIDELQMLISSGTPHEQQCARKVLPVRIKGNYLLCSIIICNVLVNAIFTTLLDAMLSGVLGIILVTIAIVLVGEILPQSLGARYGLEFSAKTIYLLRLVLILTFPVSYPLGKILDWFLGEEVGAIRTRENIIALVMATQDNLSLFKTEVNIITGALQITTKRVEDIMTHLPDCYMLSIDTLLDFDVIAEIITNGYSRIPVYEQSRSNVISILFAKDLGLINPEDNIPIGNIINREIKDIYRVPAATPVYELFEQFKTGVKGHMAFVTSTGSESFDEVGRAKEKIIGLVTLEDILEEIIKEEILDETDIYVSNRHTRRRNQRRLLKDFMKYTEEYNNNRVRISHQLILAAFQYLSTIQPFTSPLMSHLVLMRLLQMDIYHYVKPRETQMIYEAGKGADYFVMILEGRVTVLVGVEKLRFVSGPFTYFGTAALESRHVDNVAVTENVTSAYHPDYSVQAHGGVYYMKIETEMYKAALHATQVENRGEDGENVSVEARFRPLFARGSVSDEVTYSRDTVLNM